MRSLALRLYALLLALATGCSGPAPVEESTEALVLRETLAAVPSAQILGASDDRRHVAWAAPCDPGASGSSALYLYDDATGQSTKVADAVECALGHIRFSPDGELAVFFADGRLRVHRASSGQVVAVSRKDQSGIGVEFSPDGQWFVVASLGEEQHATLDAWDADLKKHREIVTDAYFSPFGPGSTSVRFSPDSQQLVYLGGLSGAFPIGTLSCWRRSTGLSKAIATGVPASSWQIDAGWTRAAFVHGAVFDPAKPPADALRGELALLDLKTQAIQSVEAGVVGLPVAFTDTTLIYLTDPFGGANATLKTFAGGKRRTIDTQVLASFAPTPAILLSAAGDRVAYQAHMDPTTFAAELRVAPLAAGKPTVVAKDAVPNAFGWAGSGATVVYLHGADSTFPGAATGKLVARDLDHGTTRQLGAHVTQIGLSYGDDTLFLEDYDAGQAIGTLTAWNTTTGLQRVLGEHVAVMSINRGPDGNRVGFLTATVDPTGQQPPATSFSLALLHGLWPTRTVAGDANTLAVGWLGRVFYTTPKGLFGAWVF